MKKESIERIRKKYPYVKYKGKVWVKYFTKEEFDLFLNEYCEAIEEKEFCFPKFVVFLKEIHISELGYEKPLAFE